MRLFAAVDLPQEIKSTIDRSLAPARARLPRARWVRAENLHLTLAFLGEVDSGQRDRAVNALKKKLEQGGGFSYGVGEIGAFPPAGKVRVVWLGLEPAAPFEALARDVREAIGEAGVPFDDKPFRAHVTVARCDPPWAPPLRATIGEQLAPLCAVFSRTEIGCDRVTLFASTLGSGGPSYRVEAEFPLQLPAGRAGGAAVAGETAGAA